MSGWRKPRLMSSSLASPREELESWSLVSCLHLLRWDHHFSVLFGKPMVSFSLSSWGHRRLLQLPLPATRNSAGVPCSWGKSRRTRRNLSSTLLLSTPRDPCHLLQSSTALGKGTFLLYDQANATSSLYCSHLLYSLSHSSCKVTFLIWDPMSPHMYSHSTRQEMSVHLRLHVQSYITPGPTGILQSHLHAC